MPRPYPIKMKTYTFKEAEESFRRYPYYIYPALSALAVATQEQRAILVRRIAAAVGDEAMLRTAIGIDPAEFADFYPDMKAPELSTSETIDTFISTFSSEKRASAPAIDNIVAAPAIDNIVAAPAIDYAAMLAADSDSVPLPGADSDSTADLLNSFLGTKPKTPDPTPEPTPAPAPELAMQPPHQQDTKPDDKPSVETISSPGYESNLSEALLKVMIKKGNYSKALEIINELSLNFPKKSIYFADQKRFLKKLMLNRERLDSAKKEGTR